jgi:regulatory protein
MQKTMNLKEALKYGMDLCSKQERCRSEVHGKLQKAGLDESGIEKVLSELEKEGFINESRYAMMFAGDKLRLNKWGRIKIRYMLYQKKIPAEIIDRALNELNPDEYEEVLRGELEKKMKTIPSGNTRDMRNKLFRFASQRGFESGLILKILDSELT